MSALSLVVLVLAAGCSAATDATTEQPAPAAVSTAAVDGASPAFAPRPGGSSTTRGSLPAGDSQSMPDVDAGPLLLGVSIHVEGWQQEAENRDMFRIHSEGLLDMGEAAAAVGAVFTFEFSEVFLDAVARWESDVIDELEAMGHGTGVHADVGGRGSPSLAQLVGDLERIRTKANALGVDVRHVSGVCSRGPWVEAVIAAGFQSTNGAVEYCATSLDPDVVPDDWDLSGCTSPAACHGQLAVDRYARIHPYLIDSSADFLTPASVGLVLMIGNSGEAIDCAAEGSTGGGACVGTVDDLPHAAELVRDYLTNRDPARVAALTMSWSVGSIPTTEFVGQFAAVFEPAVRAGDAVWAANGDIGAAALAAMPR